MLSLVLFFVGAVAPLPVAWAEEPEPELVPPTYELRFDTGTSSLAYRPNSELFSMNLGVGGGAVLADVVLGATLVLGFGAAAGYDAFAISLAPSVRYANGLSSRQSGVFGDLFGSIGVVARGDQEVLAASVGLWSGGHLFLSDDIAIPIGAFVQYERVEDLDGVAFGLRVGVSLYPTTRSERDD